MSQLDDGRLNFQELFLTGADEPDRISPTVRGDIDEQPAFYDVQEIRGIVSGDAWNYRERQDPVRTAIRTLLADQPTAGGAFSAG